MIYWGNISQCPLDHLLGGSTQWLSTGNAEEPRMRVKTDSTSSQYSQPIRTRLRSGTSRDRIELPRNAIRVIEADVLAMGPWIFLNPIVTYP